MHLSMGALDMITMAHRHIEIAHNSSNISTYLDGGLRLPCLAVRGVVGVAFRTRRKRAGTVGPSIPLHWLRIVAHVEGELFARLVGPWGIGHWAQHLLNLLQVTALELARKLQPPTLGAYLCLYVIFLKKVDQYNSYILS